MQSLGHCNCRRHRVFVKRDEVLLCCLIASSTHRLRRTTFTLSDGLDLSKSVFCGIESVKICCIFRTPVILKLRRKNRVLKADGRNSQLVIICKCRRKLRVKILYFQKLRHIYLDHAEKLHVGLECGDRSGLSRNSFIASEMFP